MSYFWNKVVENVAEFFLGSLEQRIDDCESRVTDLEQRLRTTWFDFSDDKSETDDDSDGSNLAVYMKPRINNHTLIQYVTGHDSRFEIRKNLFHDHMENVVELVADDPYKLINHFNTKLKHAGCEIDFIDDYNVIVKCDYDTVKEIILKDEDIIQ